MVSHQIRGQRQRLEAIQKHPALTSPYTILGNFYQKLDEMMAQMKVSLKGQVEHRKLRLQGFERQLATLQPIHRVIQLREKLLQLVAHLKAIDPRNLLSKGYCMVFRENQQSAIVSIQQLSPLNRVSIRFQDGSALAQIEAIKNES